MKISIGCDHGGFELKEEVVLYLKNQGFDIEDCGCYSKDSVDYPDYGFKAASLVSKKMVDRGILICTSGIGMSMVGNKLKGVRAALCLTDQMAQMSRLHNNANVLVLGSSYVDIRQAQKILDVWFGTEFEGGRHQRRVEKIHQSERDLDEPSN